MTLWKKGKHFYGDNHADIQTVITAYSRANAYLATHFRDVSCACGADQFQLLVDDNEGVGLRTCTACGLQHPIGDSQDYLESADLEECACPCGNSAFQLAAGVALYADSQDVRWLYLGCRCPQCSLVAVYADWKNEYPNYQEFLDRI